MDEQHFDHFARTFAAATTRRGALRIVASAAGGLLALVVAGDASAAKACASDADCAKRQVCDSLTLRCVKKSLCDISEKPTCPPCTDTTCDLASGAWMACGGPGCTNDCTRNPITCTCDTPEAGTAYCYLTNICVSNACRADQFFVTSTCTCRCPDGTTDCGGACVDTQTDKHNCGTCGNACPADSLSPDCVGGLCGCASNTSCNPAGGPSTCCTDVLPTGTCCCTGRITWPSTGQDVCNPCAPDTTFCYCNDGIGGWGCCASGELCIGCSGGGTSGVPLCAAPK